MSINKNSSIINIIESHKQFNNSGLTCTCRSNDSNLLSRLNIYTEILDDSLVLIVSKSYMLEINLALNSICRNRILNSLVFLFFIKEFKYSFRSCCHRLYLIDNLSNLLYWLCEVLHILDKCLNITDCYNIFNSKKTAC